MKQEELIYRITRAVFERMGAGADETTVEQIVTGVYQAIEPVLAANSSSALHGPRDQRAEEEPRIDRDADERVRDARKRLIISVFGVDHPGIVAGVSQVLAEADCSIVDINQTVVQGKFAMVIIVDMSRARESAAQLKERFRKAGERLGVRIYSQREDLFNAMHRV